MRSVQRASTAQLQRGASLRLRRCRSATVVDPRTGGIRQGIRAAMSAVNEHKNLRLESRGRNKGCTWRADLPSPPFAAYKNGGSSRRGRLATTPRRGAPSVLRSHAHLQAIGGIAQYTNAAVSRESDILSWRRQKRWRERIGRDVEQGRGEASINKMRCRLDTARSFDRRSHGE